MENRNPRYRSVLVSALFAGLVACGDQATNQQAAQTAPPEEVAQCSLAMPANSTALQVQQKLFPPESTAVATQLTTLVYDAMTRNQDGDPVLAVRPADRPLSPRHADRSS